MKNRKLKFGLSVGGVVALGIALPVVSRGEHTSSDSRAIWAGVIGSRVVGFRHAAEDFADASVTKHSITPLH